MESKQEKTPLWETVAENLLRNTSSGRYYGRFKIAGKKEKWIALKTTRRAVADTRLTAERAKIAGTRRAVVHVAEGAGTMGELAKIYADRLRADASIGDKTRRRYLEHAQAVMKTWPELATMKPDRLTKGAVLAWRDRVRRDGTGFVAPGTKGRGKSDGTSPGTINKMVDAIRRMVEIAIDQGQLSASPLAGRGIKLRVAPKKPRLPSVEMVEAVFRQIESRGEGRPRDCAELCRLLAYTGLRVGEAAGDPENETPGLRWCDVDFARGVMRVNGTKTDSSCRDVPMIPAARTLLEKMRERRVEGLRELHGPEAKLNPTDRILFVSEAQKALTRACAEVGVARLTHHDLRDVFATTCIEAGVDIPTVARWLGHADGGALLMKTYSHLRDTHSIAMAAKVTMGEGRATP